VNSLPADSPVKEVEHEAGQARRMGAPVGDLSCERCFGRGIHDSRLMLDARIDVNRAKSVAYDTKRAPETGRVPVLSA
jgi:hypothetical protein